MLAAAAVGRKPLPPTGQEHSVQVALAAAETLR